jgi:ABC-type dipeptide/oligopeptide/nickel transport system permease component
MLTGTALVLVFVIGILIGVLQAVRQYSLFDSSSSVISLFFYSMPSFWLALMLMLSSRSRRTSGAGPLRCRPPASPAWTTSS